MATIKVKTEGSRYTMGGAPKPKTDMEGKQRRDRMTGEELFTSQLIQFNDEGAEVLNITTPGAPTPAQGDDVVPVGLIAIPWQQGQRSGVAYRADGIELAPLASGAGTGSASSAKGSAS
jgi:hypothetical protein